MIVANNECSASTANEHRNRDWPEIPTLIRTFSILLHKTYYLRLRMHRYSFLFQHFLHYAIHSNTVAYLMHSHKNLLPFKHVARHDSRCRLSSILRYDGPRCSFTYFAHSLLCERPWLRYTYTLIQRKGGLRRFRKFLHSRSVAPGSLFLR